MAKYYRELTSEEKAAINLDSMKTAVDSMGHEEMCRMWRFHGAETYSPYFDSSHPICEYFRDRLFKHFGGFTPEISKSIGW